MEYLLEQLRKYCNYQDRCQEEVRRKLRELGATAEEAGEVMVQLIQEGALNEERFAINFARGKSRIKKWGRQKIAAELKKKQVSEYCINKALSLLNSEDYNAELMVLARKKYSLLRKGQKAALASQKLFRFLLQKGYESSVIAATLKTFEDEDHDTESN